MTTDEFILAHRTDDVRQLALRLRGRSSEETRYILQQIEGWQRLRNKVPSWAAKDGLHYPVRLSLEQCSSEATALYKATAVSRPASIKGTFIDLTGGLGVDFSFMARGFGRAVYVERDAALCALARHNFPLLGLDTAEVVEGDGVEYLRTMEGRAAVIYLDPFRRDEAGHKTVRIEDCTPNVLDILPLLREHASQVIVKLSPMLDLTQALRSISQAAPSLSLAAYIVGSQGEVKEILISIDCQAASPSSAPVITCHDDQTDFCFTADEESAAPFSVATLPTSALPGHYLYEPSSVIMKAGCFRLVAARFGVEALHRDTHLYLSRDLHPEFPGRQFRILRTTGFGKRELRDFLRTAPEGKANLAVRNFPMSVAELRRRLRLAEGGEEYWFAATTATGEHVLMACEKQQPHPAKASCGTLAPLPHREGDNTPCGKAVVGEGSEG